MSNFSSSSCTFQDVPYISQYCTANSNADNSGHLFMTLVDFMIRTSSVLSDPCHRASTNKKQETRLETLYDYVVIGGGVAGSVIAGRLSENPNVSVLLLEAGPDEPSASRVPGLLLNIQGSQLDYSYKTEKNAKACLSTGGICTWPRGKLLGGTGTFSGMLYTRPSPSIFDDWENKYGNKGWNSKEVLKYFKKCETNLNPDLIEKDQHGTEGPMTIQRFPSYPAIADDILKSAEIVGYKGNDMSGSNPNGLNLVQTMVVNGTRATTPRMYLTNKYKQSNLFVKLNAQVMKIVLNGTKAIGVVYKDLETKKVVTINVKKEVILSGGAIGSPQLLMLSGIGPKEHLDSLKIPVVKDLKVGYNLLHHVSISVNYTINENAVRSLNIDELVNYLSDQKGVLSSSSMSQLTGFFKSQYSNLNDLQLYFDGYTPDCSETGYRSECVNGLLTNKSADYEELLNKLSSIKTSNNAEFIDHLIRKYEKLQAGSAPNEPLPCGRRQISVRPNNLLPLSVGKLELRSADIDDHPKLMPNYFSNEVDAKILLDGIRIAQKIMQTETMKKYDIQLSMTPCRGLKEDTDEYWLCVIQEFTLPENHQMGSCKMGPASDPEAVVNDQLLVHGIENVRVADASVIPTNINCNPISVVIMIGEKCAAMILNSEK